MDETTVYFAIESKKTVEVAGLKTIHMQYSTNDRKQGTKTVTMTASAHQLHFNVIFEGESGGHIAKDEIPHYPTGHLYAMQKKAWMDESVMFQGGIKFCSHKSALS